MASRWLCRPASHAVSLPGSRSALGPAGTQLEATREQVGLATSVQPDHEEFRRLIGAGDPAAAIALCRGRLLSDLDDEWVLEAREEHERELSTVLAELAAGAAARDDRTSAVGWARRRLALDPLSEEAARDLMRVLSTSGDRAGVLATYERLRERFRSELGISPSAETRALARDLSRGEVPGPQPLAAAEPDLLGNAALLTDALPFTGRIAELEALVEAWRQARRGRGGIAAVTGEAGIGKTRIAAKLIETARVEGATIASCAALDLGGGSPFGLWAELLRDLVGAYGAPPDDLPWVADLARLSPQLQGALPPTPPSSPQLERVRLFEATVAMLEWAARKRPCLLLFEDVHTADPASLELVAYVARRLPRLPVLIMLTRRDLPARAEVDSLLHRLPLHGIAVREIELGPLPAGDMRRLVRTAEDLEAEQVERVVAMADGNPLLAVETARA